MPLPTGILPTGGPAAEPADVEATSQATEEAALAALYGDTEDIFDDEWAPDQAPPAPRRQIDRPVRRYAVPSEDAR